MSFFHINPGYSELLDISGTTVESEIYNPYGGVSFWQTSSDYGITLPEIPTEIYIKVLAYLRGMELGSSTLNMYVKAGNSNGFGIRKSSAGWYVDILCNNSQFSSVSRAESGIITDGINEFLYHGKAGSESSAVITLSLNGKAICNVSRYLTFNKSGSYASASDRVVLSSSNAYGLISNVIIADSEIAWDEKVAIVSAKDTETDMADNGDGSYTADTAGQYILQSLDVNSLIGAEGGTSKVRGVALRADPAYRTGSSVTSLTSCQKAGGVVTDYETKSLGTDADGKVMSCARLSNLTLNDLWNYKFGWKAGDGSEV